MAPKFPIYQRQGQLNARIMTPPDIDQAALRETRRGFAELSQRAEQVQNFAFKRAAETAQAEGQAAGSQNPEAVLAQYQGKAPTDIYGKAAFNAANAIGSVKIESAAREAIGNAYIEAKKTRQDPNDFQASLGAIINGYTAPLDDMDPLTAAKTRAKLESYARSAFLDRSGDALKEQQKELDGQALSLLETSLEEIDLMAQAGLRGGDRALADKLKLYEDSQRALGRSAKQIAADKAKMRDRYHLSRARREFRDAKDKSAWLKKFAEDRKTGTGTARGLDDNRIEILTNSFEHEVKQGDRLRDASIAGVNSEIKDSFKVLSKNGSVSNERINQLRAKAEDLGDKNLIQSVALLEKEQQELGDIMRGGSVAIQEAADHANAQIEALRKAGKDTPVNLLDKQKRLQSLAEARRRAEKEDPLAALSRSHGAGTPSELSISDMTIPDKMRDAIQANVNASRLYGVPTVYLTQDTIAKLKETLSITSDNFQLQAAIVSSIQKAAGDKAPAVFAQIASQTESTDLAHIGSIMKPELMMEYFKGRQALASGGRIPNLDVQGMRQELNRFVGQTLGRKPGLVGDLEATSQAIYLARYPNKEFDNDKYENILHELVGGSGTGETARGGKIKYGDDELILPPNHLRDENAFAKTIESITDNEINSLSETHGVPVYENQITGELIPITANMLPGLKLESYGSGLYVLRDSRGNLVARKMRSFTEEGEELSFLHKNPYILDLNKLSQ